MTTRRARLARVRARVRARGQSRGRGRGRRGEAGSVSAELVVFVVPTLILLAMFVLFCGRSATAAIDVRAAAAAGARSAADTSTPSEARRAAYHAVAAATSGAPWSCDTTVDATDLHPGGQVRVRVDCRVRLHDLGLPGITSRTVTATATEPLDTYRADGQTVKATLP